MDVQRIASFAVVFIALARFGLRLLVTRNDFGDAFEAAEKFRCIVGKIDQYIVMLTGIPTTGNNDIGKCRVRLCAGFRVSCVFTAMWNKAVGLSLIHI